MAPRLQQQRRADRSSLAAAVPPAEVGQGQGSEVSIGGNQLEANASGAGPFPQNTTVRKSIQGSHFSILGLF